MSTRECQRHDDPVREATKQHEEILTIFRVLLLVRGLISRFTLQNFGLDNIQNIVDFSSYLYLREYYYTERVQI